MICFIDYRTTKEETDNIEKLNLQYIKVPKCPLVHKSIDGHVDIQMNILDKSKRKIIVHKDIDISFLNEINKFNIDYIFSDKCLNKDYPEDIILNYLSINNLFVHNTKYTDKIVLDNIKDKKIINVKQGYTKCSVLPINDNAAITSDKIIAKKLSENNIDVLRVPHGDIMLPGMNYGFIGGVGGLISPNKLALFGQLSEYCFGNEVYNFLYKYDVEPIYLKKGKLIDRGSIFCLD